MKQAIVKVTDRDIVVCGISTGEPSWHIRNKLADRLLQIEAEKPWSEAADIIRKVSAGSLRIAFVEGKAEENGAVLGGQVVGSQSNFSLPNTNGAPG